MEKYEKMHCTVHTHSKDTERGTMGSSHPQGMTHWRQIREWHNRVSVLVNVSVISEPTTHFNQAFTFARLVYVR